MDLKTIFANLQIVGDFSQLLRFLGTSSTMHPNTSSFRFLFAI